MALAARENLFDIDRLVNRLWHHKPKVEAAESDFLAPRVDIKELGNHYEITVELPGVKRDDLNITLVDGLLAIAAEAQHKDEANQEGKVIRQERRQGKLVRSFTIGNEVQEKDIDAKVADGVLTLDIPKIQDAKAPKKHSIPVN